MKPDVIGITSITPTISDAIRTVIDSKAQLPGAITVMGGCHITALPLETMESCQSLDCGVIGEGETTLLELVRANESGSEIDGVDGVIHRLGGSGGKDGGRRIAINRMRRLTPDLDSIPFPARHLLPLDRYTILSKRAVIGSMITSRGCPYNCIFCSSSKFYGRAYRARSPKNVVDEIEELVRKYQLKFVEFIDDTMTLNGKRAESIAREIIRRRLDISWGFGSRVDLVTEDMLKLFKRAGCIMFYMGIESGSERIIRALKKGISLDQVKRAIACAKKAGIETTGTFILGSPWESRDDAVRTINFAKSCGIDFAQFTVLTPYPGTEAYEMACREGLLEESEWAKFTTIHPVMRTRHLGRDELAKLVGDAYKSFYLRGKFIMKMVGTRRLQWVVPVVKHYMLKRSYT